MDAALPPNLLLYGSRDPLPETTALRAGPLSLNYIDGDLRQIRLGPIEIVQRIYVAVRDHNWGTVPATLSNVQIDQSGSSFEIRYDARHTEGVIDFAWHGTITGSADGTLSFNMVGQARSTFARNRIGICVLHPATCAGQPCAIEHTDGSIESGAFPTLIAPHQPFINIRAITHDISPDARAELRFDGDVFEMEDQRNWTDASFKTYSTPLALPFPVTIESGTRIQQSVTLRLHENSRNRRTGSDDPTVPITIGAPRPDMRVPLIGLGMAGHNQPLTATDLERLRALHLAHLRIDLDPSQPHSAETLDQANTAAQALDVPLEIALHVTGRSGELTALRKHLALITPRIARWIVFQVGRPVPDDQLIEVTQRSLAAYDRAVPIGSGTDANFAELNRNRPSMELLDFLSFSITPQVHAFDNLSLIENLAGQAAAVESARILSGGRPIVISPVTLKPRFNASATAPEPEAPPERLPPQVDPRQATLFGAAWTVGSIKALAEGGVQSVTYYETSGWRGVMETEAGSPAQFPSLAGGVFPMYHVFADVGAFAGGDMLPLTTSDPLRCTGIALQRGQEQRLIIANLSAAEQNVRIVGVGAPARVRMLDDLHVVAAMRDPAGFRAAYTEAQPSDQQVLRLSLRPYGVACIDCDRIAL